MSNRHIHASWRILSIPICMLFIVGCGGGGGGTADAPPAPQDTAEDAAGDGRISDVPAAADGMDTDAPEPDSFQWELPSDSASPDVIVPPPEDHCEAIECLECVYYVRIAGSDDGDGTSPGTAFATLQPALDAAAAAASYCCRCEVRVGAGTYNVFSAGPDDTIALRERVSLLGGYPPELDGARDPTTHETVLDGRAPPESPGGQVYHVVTGADEATLEGFTITGGYATAEEAPAADTPHFGGGMLNVEVSPTVKDCVFLDNYAQFGAGVYNVDNAPTFSGCRFEDNYASVEGGGMYNLYSAPILEDPVFVNNQAGGGGGGLVVNGASAATVTGTGEGGCLFDANTGWGNAGGVLVDSSELSISACDFTGNKGATMGGAILSREATLDVTGCSFQGNWTYVECDYTSCGKRGGAVGCEGGVVHVTDSSFTDNEGWSCVEVGGMGGHQECSGLGGAVGAFAGADLTLSGCSFQGNLGGAGGAVGVREASLTGADLDLSGNEAPHPTSEEGGARGGAIHLHDAIAVIDGMACVGNIANNGGCLFSWNSEVRVNRARIEHHAVSQYGGAAYIYNGPENGAPVLFDGCLFKNNIAWAGGALFLDLGATPPGFNGCTFFGNAAEWDNGRALHIQGVQEGQMIPISNTIIWGHEDPIVAWDGTEPVFDDHTVNTQSNAVNLGTQWDDPTFVDPPEDLRLSSESTCVDAGANMFNSLELDLDGNPRIVNEIVDMGAYERQEVQ